jgi:hypothetical protein
MKTCELCGVFRPQGMRYAKHMVCFDCIDKTIEFAITAGLSYKEGSE